MWDRDRIRLSRRVDQERLRALGPTLRPWMGHDPLVRSPLAILAVATLAVIDSACVPLLMVTPGLPGGGFTLPQDEWGGPEDHVVLACYRKTSLILPVPRSHHWAWRYRILQPSAKGEYTVPRGLEWGTLALVTVLGPDLVVPMEPYVCIVGPDGHYGCFDARGRIVGPVPTISRSGKELRVTGSPPKGPALDADGVLAGHLCQMLSRHDPEGKHRSLIRPDTCLSRSDAQTLAAFIGARPDAFSRTTRILSRRLAEHYELTAESTDWKLLASWYVNYGGRPELEELLPLFKPDARDFFQKQLGEFMAQEPRTAEAERRTCDICGKTIPDLAALRSLMMPRESLPRFLQSIDADPQRNWQETDARIAGMIRLDLCTECLSDVAKKRRHE